MRLLGPGTRLDGSEEQWAWCKFKQIGYVLDINGYSISDSMSSTTGYDQLTRAKSVHLKVQTS